MNISLFFSPKPHGKRSKMLNVEGHIVYVRSVKSPDGISGIKSKFVDEVGVELDLSRFKRLEKI